MLVHVMALAVGLLAPLHTFGADPPEAASWVLWTKSWSGEISTEDGMTKQACEDIRSLVIKQDNIEAAVCVNDV